MNYLEMLEHSYEMDGINLHERSRAAYLSESIFDFTVYDDGMSELFGIKALEVCCAITDKTTFDYIKDEESYKWYLVMVNMPFFENKLEWGTSIRGAWWKIDDKTFELHSCGIYEEGEQLMDISFNPTEWNEFVNAMREFVSK